uniref:Uncharacterized protein n=1 Tax=Palpitomonas bilix TaxID=652834 RepID=A0A7S3D0X2_9EUKA|mmetsp:Transcript_17699/g.43927  ORF Transcript_17699/g.43927 Transcript_17699/m.43927 type:complete len:224 (+) Transcript_17699:749-1420(+)
MSVSATSPLPHLTPPLSTAERASVSWVGGGGGRGRGGGGGRGSAKRMSVRPPLTSSPLTSSMLLSNTASPSPSSLSSSSRGSILSKSRRREGRNDTTAVQRRDIQKLDGMLETTKVDDGAEFLFLVFRVCRALRAGRMVMCKSAKDRTAMLVTAEEALVAREELQVDLAESTLMAALRNSGVRRENARMNVGKDKFAFNELQRRFLPKRFRPNADVSDGVIRS